MKNFILIMLIASMNLFAASSYSQQMKLSLEFNDSELKEVLKEIRKQTEFTILYKSSDVKDVKSIDADFENATVMEILDKCLEGTSLSYDVKDKVIVIHPIPYVKPAPPVKKEQEKDKVIRGQVTDENGESLPGVSVIIKGTTSGVSTDINGNYTLKIPVSGASLMFSFVGMESQEIFITDQLVMNVALKYDQSQLGEVVVTGFQTISKERSTGSYSILKNEELEMQIVSNISTALEGKIAGLSSYNGELVIRGVGTFNANKKPLIVVDGLPTEVGLSSINPSDIESITVLKDAAAASIYGARSSNGVIVVTTKTAKSGTTQIDFSADFSITDKMDLDYHNYASTGDIIDHEINYLENNPSFIADPLSYFNGMDGNHVRYSKVFDYYRMAAAGEITQAEAGEQINNLRQYDYRKEYRKHVLQNPTKQQYNLSVRKATDKSNLLISANVVLSNSTIETSDYEKCNLYLKNSMKLNDWFTVGYGANVILSNSKSAQSVKGFKDPLPYERIFDDNGNRVNHYYHNQKVLSDMGQVDGLPDMGYNVMDELDRDFAKNSYQNLRLFVNTDIKLAKGLKYSAKFQYEKINSNTERYSEKESYSMRQLVNKYAVVNNSNATFYIPNAGKFDKNYSAWINYTLRNQISFDKSFGTDHEITAIAGTEIRETYSEGQKTELYGYDDQTLSSQFMDWKKLASGVDGVLQRGTQRLQPDDNVDEVKHRYFSLYANTGYTFKGKYNFNASIRVDQADLFGTDPKYRYRPLWSVGAAWNISKEEFLQNNDWINMLKLRASYGVNGNVDQSSSPYLVAHMFSNWKTGNLSGTIMTPPNPLLRWEKTSTYNFGVDFSIFNNRLNGTVDVYHKYSSDLLARKNLDPALGFTFAKVNNGAMSNNGVELSLSYNWINTKNFNWNSSVVVAWNKNEVEKIDTEIVDGTDLIKYPKSYYEEGKAYNSLYAYKYAGLTEEGDPSVYDAEGNVVMGEPLVDPEALEHMGQLDPTYNGSFSNTVRYKNFELSALIVFYGGHQLRKDVTPLYETLGSGSIHKDVTNAWTPENTNTDIPRMATYAYNQHRKNHWKYANSHVLDATFVKLRNVVLGYNLPQNIAKKFHAKSLKVKAQVTNPLYWSSAGNNIDPEAFNANGGSRRNPQMSSWSVGVKLGF